MKEKQPFYTEKLYEDDFTVVGVLNELNDKDLISNKESYTSGSLLFVDVNECPESRDILSAIISNIDDYLKGNNESFLHSDTDLGLSLLIDDYEKHFKSSIKWDNDMECFYVD